MSGWRTQSPDCQTKEYGAASSLLVIKHNVWFPDLLCGDMHELHPLVVRGFPFQLVVIPDLVEEGGEMEAWFMWWLGPSPGNWAFYLVSYIYSPTYLVYVYMCVGTCVGVCLHVCT